MTDPGRLSDSGSSDERAMLRAARSLHARSATRQRALISLGLGSALTLAPATAIAALKWLKGAGASAIGLMGTQWGAGVLITSVAVGAVTVHVAQRADEPAPPVTLSVPRPAAAPPALAPATPPTLAAASESAPELPRAGPPPRVVGQPAPVPSAAVATELELLDRAREQLRSGDAAAALAALREHQQVYPRGNLATEARVLRIEALGSAGKRAQAVSEAQQFLEQRPNSLLSRRVRRWLDNQEAR